MGLASSARLDWFWFLAMVILAKYMVLWPFEGLFEKSKPVESLFKEIPFTKPQIIILMRKDVAFSSVNKLVKKGEWWTMAKSKHYLFFTKKITHV